MAAIPLGSRALAAAADTTGLNPGNWTCYFSAAVLATRVPYYEIYSISLTGLAQVTTVTVYINGQVRTTAKLFGNAEWDPAQPMLMAGGDELALALALAAAGAPPAATLWLRYDPAINKDLL